MAQYAGLIQMLGPMLGGMQGGGGRPQQLGGPGPGMTDAPGGGYQPSAPSGDSDMLQRFMRGAQGGGTMDGAMSPFMQGRMAGMGGGMMGGGGLGMILQLLPLLMSFNPGKKKPSEGDE